MQKKKRDQQKKSAGKHPIRWTSIFSSILFTELNQQQITDHVIF